MVRPTRELTPEGSTSADSPDPYRVLGEFESSTRPGSAKRDRALHISAHAIKMSSPV